MVNGYTPEQAFDALLTIPATIDHDTRARLGMGAKDAGVSLEDYDAWQSANPRYNAVEVRSMWHSFTDGPVKAGTLFAIAKEHGWAANGTASHKPAPARISKPVEPQRKPAPGMAAAEVWNRCQPATNQHGYIQAKQGNADGLRVVPDGDRLSIAGQNMAGYLAVPSFAPDGEIQSLQFIPAGGGKKLNLPGASMAGASFTLGTDGPVYLCEGIGAAWSAWKATGHRAVCCFGWGNVGKVAQTLRQREPDTKMVICPDVGKEAAAAEIAALHHCAVATMPKGSPDNSDINDLFCSPDGGFDVVQAMLEAATMPPKPEPLLKPVSVFDVLTNPSPPPAFVWDGYLPRGQVSLLGAHGGTGKSTIALMLAVCAALGRPLFGVATEPCNVLFVSLEDGVNIVRHRLASICRAWMIDPAQLHGRLHIVDGTEHPELFTAEPRGAGDLTQSYRELHRLVRDSSMGLVVVDNASDAYGGDEIQRRQVRAFIRSLAEVARLVDAAVMLLAHVDKATSRARKSEGGEGYSGSTAWNNSVRSRMFMSRGEDGLLTLEHQKSNLGRLCEPLTLEWLEGGLPQMVQGFDSDGFNQRQHGRADDDRAAALLKLIAEFEGRGQYASPSPTARNNVHNLLKSEPAFIALKLRPDDTKRIVNQCQRAKWLEPLDYRSKHTNKNCQRWELSPEGRAFAGLPAVAPTAPTAPTCHVVNEGALGANGGAPTAPTYVGGMGDRAHPISGAKAECQHG